jgi:ADP-ribose pyrophosphatase
LYLATNLQPAASGHEEHEVIEVHWKPLREVVRMAEQGEIRDGKSLVGIFRANARLAARSGR